jgi:hypothetical protein
LRHPRSTYQNAASFTSRSSRRCTGTKWTFRRRRKIQGVRAKPGPWSFGPCLPMGTP